MGVKDLPIEVVRERIAYDPNAGSFHWKVDRSATCKKGNVAGCYRKNDGYFSLNFGDYRARVLSHRAAWAIVTEAWPSGEIDHINGDRSDNRWVNLRNVSKTENMRNTRKKNSSSPKIGVSWVKKRKAWVAAIKTEGAKIHLIQTPDFFEACCARKSAEKLYGFHENHGLLSRKDYSA